MKLLKSSISIIILTMLVFMLVSMPKVNAWETASFDIQGLNSNGNALVDTTVYVTFVDLQTKYSSDFTYRYNNDYLTVYYTIDGVKVDAVKTSTGFSYTIKQDDKGKSIRFVVERKPGFGSSLSESYDVQTKSYPIVSNASITADKPDSNGIMPLTGQIEKAGLEFTNMYVDDEFYTNIDKTSFNYNLDTRQFKVGVHKLTIKLNDGRVLGPIYFYTAITETPKNKVSYVKTYSNFLTYNVNYSVNSEYDGVYVQLKKGNGKWGSYYGPIKSWEKKKIKGLSQNTTYQIRTVFIKNAGTSNQIMGPYSGTITVKTGKKAKPSVKSIKVSNVKQKKRYIAGRTWWDAGGVKHSTKGRYVYTTTYKITVNLKKKPGTKGIYIGENKLKGNKKKYTLKVKLNGKQKGKKVKVSVMSYNNNSYGAYSGIYTKKIKIK